MSINLCIAYCRGQNIRPYLDILTRFCDKVGRSLWYYDPTSFSSAGESGLCHIRIGEGNTPLCAGEAQVLVALEELEGRRALRYLAKDGIIVLCRIHRLPLCVSTGAVGYPSDTLDVLTARPLWAVPAKEYHPITVGALMLRAMGVQLSDALSLLSPVGEQVELVNAAYGKSMGV
ncbi:MAG: hypothetical protein J5755_05900 [Clostridia bacterium]|nr:hypothetical protein [Clostridia bacterium]